jgi:hypothetical protein
VNYASLADELLVVITGFVLLWTGSRLALPAIKALSKVNGSLTAAIMIGVLFVLAALCILSGTFVLLVFSLCRLG